MWILETMFSLSGSGINPVYPYADAFMGPIVKDLSDFFDCLPNTCQHPFQPITLVSNQLCNQTQCKSNQCDATCFINYYGSPMNPDDE